MARVLVTEEIAERGLARLREAGHEVDVRLVLSPEQLLAAVPGAEALIIRSASRHFSWTWPCTSHWPWSRGRWLRYLSSSWLSPE